MASLSIFYSKIIIKRKEPSYGLVLVWTLIAIVKKNKDQRIIKLIGIILSILVFLPSILITI